MASDDLVEAPPEGREVEIAGEPQNRGDVVERAARQQAVEEPEPLLGEGERRLGRPRRDEIRRLAMQGAGCGVDPRGEPGHGRGLEDRAQRELDPERLPDAGAQPGGEERVPAEIEEVCRAPRALAVPGARPRSPRAALGGCPRGLAAEGPLRGREGPAVDLAVERSAAAGTGTKAAGTMCSGRWSRRRTRSAASSGASPARHEP